MSYPFSEEVSKELNRIKKDMDFTSEELEKVYNTGITITLTDLLRLRLHIKNELSEIFDWAEERDKQVTEKSIYESLSLGPLGLFEESLEQRGKIYK